MFKKIQSIDDKVIDNIIKIRSPLKNKIMIAASSAGNLGIIWFVICLPFLIYAPWRLTGVNIIFALGFTQLICEVMLKHIVRRERPVWSLPDEEQLIHRPKYYSFPSGHTSASFCVVAVSLLRAPWPVTLIVLFCAIMVSSSRVYLRVHYLSDVVVGMILGLLCGSTSVAIFNQVVQNFTK
jgi:undecaprenyl-diphosphatase